MAMVKFMQGGIVNVPGFGHFTEERWINTCEIALRVWRESVGKPWNENAIWAHRFLQANGIRTLEAFEALEKNLPLLKEGPDPSRIVYCRRCQRPLSDPLSKALGIGPDCRVGGVQARRELPAWTAKLAAAA